MTRYLSRYPTHFVVFCTILLLGACGSSPLTVHSVVKDQPRLTELNSFSIHARTDIQGEQIDMLNSAMAQELTNKGYTVAEDAEMLVIYQLEVKEGEELVTESVNIRNRVLSRPRLEAVYEAAILINVFDSKTGDLLWKASSTRDLTQVNTVHYTQDRANKAASELFESFPEHEQ